MADQCIVCLENLDVQLTVAPQSQHDNLDLHESSPPSATAPPSVFEVVTVAQPVQPPLDAAADGIATIASEVDDDSKIAEIQICGHVLHDSCLREWTGKANSCPICRQTFHLVNVYDRVGGTKLSSYTVQDKKQIAEFDAQTWLDENPEPELPATPCPLCESTDHEDVLLLCDGCDAPYHTYCVGLDCVPRGHWFCMECVEQHSSLVAAEIGDPEDVPGYGLPGVSHRNSDYLPRTRETMRRARLRARSDEWQGAWGQIAGHVFDALDIDLDNHEDDEALQNYRRSQRRRQREESEYQRWQQRLNIASRLGARDVFANNLPGVAPQVQQPPPTPQETLKEKKAWEALEKAMEATNSNATTTATTTTSSRRKRKSRSATTSPREPPQPQEERRFKRPRTKRVPQSTEASSSNPQNGESSRALSTLPAADSSAAPPSFLSSLLKEVEMSTQSDEEMPRPFLASHSRGTGGASSPATSPAPSGYSSPRALSTTPPPRGITDRPGSPLSLTSHIEPVYPPANFSPTRNGSDQSGSDSETLARRQRHQNGATRHYHADLRHPRPRRQYATNVDNTPASHSADSSPTRESLTLGTKESISAIIKAALKPHYKSGDITTDQYTAINRDLSRKLYKEVPKESLDDDTRRRCEMMATKEVAKAVSDLKEIKV